jgi:hypothetical protein
MKLEEDMKESASDAAALMFFNQYAVTMVFLTSTHAKPTATEPPLFFPPDATNAIVMTK